MNGKKIVLLKLQNAGGAYIEVCNYGATLVSMVVPDRHGKLGNMVLRYNRIEDYLSDKFYLGSAVGRFANRIAKAQFQLNGKIYLLDKNDGNNSNHGGFAGFNSRLFDYEEKSGKIVFSYFSPDGEGGFPGNMHLTIIYSFSDDNELTVEYRAISDRETVFSPTCHAYFNLSAGKNTILDHELKVLADDYLETDSEFIPTGKILPVAHSAFDFRDFQKISALMPLKNEILAGYNTCFIAASKSDSTKLLASLREPDSGRCLDVYASLPAIQVYTGDYLSAPFHPFDGIALEAQFYPDAPNRAHFPSCLISPGKEAKHVIKFCVSIPYPA